MITDSTSFVLVIGLYKGQTQDREDELVRARIHNLSNPLISEVVFVLEDEASRSTPELSHPKARLVEFGHRCTYEDLFEVANRDWSGRLVAIANADIWFDERFGVDSVKYFSSNSKVILAATHEGTCNGQDAWFFVSPLPTFPCKQELGRFNCEYRMAWEATRAGISVVNVSPQGVIHEHRSGIRAHLPQAKGPHLNPANKKPVVGRNVAPCPVSMGVRDVNRMIVHASGISKEDPTFLGLEENNFKITTQGNVTIVTYSDQKDGPSLLERQLIKNGIPYIIAKIDGKYNNDPFYQKIHALRDVLPHINTEWILALDAFDVVLNGNLGELVSYVSSRDLVAFFGAEWGHWPSTCNTKKRETQIHPNSMFQFLNSGVGVIKTGWIREKMETLLVPVSDQPFFKELYVSEFPKVDIDHEARFILNLNGLDRENGLYTREENEKLVMEARQRVSSLPQKEIGVIFATHRMCETTNKNFESFKESNPDAEVILVNTSSPPLSFGDNFDTNDFWVTLNSSDENLKWSNSDALYYEYYRRRNVNCKRWLLAEWDLFCNGDLREFFGPLWDNPFVSSDIHLPGDGWYWFKDVENLPKEAQKFAAGISPLTGTLISDECMEKIVRESWWVRYPVFCELRIATLARMAGYEPVSNPNGQGVRWRPRPVILGPGLWHPMKGPQNQPLEMNPVGEWKITHEQWAGTMKISEDGTFSRVGTSDHGFWYPIKGGITLEWEKWPPESAIFDGKNMIGTRFEALRK